MEITDVISKLEKLSADQKPLWGNMSAQRMVEHIADTLKIASGKVKFDQVVPEDKIEKMQAFLETDKPMLRNIEVNFASPKAELRHEEIELAVDEVVMEWVDFEEYFESNPGIKTHHPYYGMLNYEQWKKLNDKHLSHHFEQFGI
jgi:hypothetical protein